MKTIVLAFGNPLVKEDRLALDVCRKLRKNAALRGKGIRFVECSRPERLLEYAKPGNKVFVLDVAKGIRSVAFVDVSKLRLQKSVSAHGIGVESFLKLCWRAGFLGENIKVIGVPFAMKDARKAAEKTSHLISGIR